MQYAIVFFLISYHRLKKYVNQHFNLYKNDFFVDRISQSNDLPLFHSQRMLTFFSFK